MFKNISKQIVFLSLLVNTLFFSGCVTPVKVEGSAMLPNFTDGDRLLMNNNIGGLQRGDLVYFQYPKDITKSYFKRVIGLPKETIEIRSGDTFINGQPLAEAYINQIYNQIERNLPPTVIPADNYFVMGDNRDNSSDSRSWGTISRDLILGKHYMTYSRSEKK
ncbi:MAG: signal peptidase I [Pyrinomonadaceae bacterium]